MARVYTPIPVFLNRSIVKILVLVTDHGKDRLRKYVLIMSSTLTMQLMSSNKPGNLITTKDIIYSGDLQKENCFISPPIMY